MPEDTQKGGGMRCTLKPPNSHRLWLAPSPARVSRPGRPLRQSHWTILTTLSPAAMPSALWWLWCKLLLTPGPKLDPSRWPPEFLNVTRLILYSLRSIQCSGWHVNYCVPRLSAREDLTAFLSPTFYFYSPLTFCCSHRSPISLEPSTSHLVFTHLLSVHFHLLSNL